ncbi:C40 family peptidase [Croceivirga thetidis]|uniref:C40 family peptidase n=1 Tax=Croceivirga thetidis TaxID=2721623 RepID=UPI0031F52E7B
MKKIIKSALLKIVCFTSLFLFVNCVAKKKTSYTKKRTVTIEASEEKSNSEATENEYRSRKAEKVIGTALGFSGVRYKYGGTTRKGMDCSGLIYTSLLEHDIDFPRVSYQMADEGKRISLKEVKSGDLLFFRTSKNGKRINHVGLVVEVTGDEIRFIHSTSSRGVIVSSLREGFWNSTFIKATRIL